MIDAVRESERESEAVNIAKVASSDKCEQERNSAKGPLTIV